MDPKKLFWSYPILLFLAGRIAAAPLLTEGFETYNPGELDADDGASPNATSVIPNNPWAGLFPPNLVVLGVETNNGITVTPHGGTNMVRGRFPAVFGGDFDQEYYNLGYWLNATNGGGSIMGNFYVDWWFFDPLGQGTNGLSSTNFCDYLAVANYPNIPTNAPYASDLASDGAGNPNVRLSLGGTEQEDGTFDGTKYQTLVFGATTNSYDANGWVNLPLSRNIGWHHARIEISSQKADLTVDTRLFIDDLGHPLLTPNIAATNGFNCLEINANFGNISGYWDDITVGTLPPPTPVISRVGTSVVLTWPSSWKLQASPAISPTAWTDVLDANTNFVSSPYTNSNPASTLFFRLRN